MSGHIIVTGGSKGIGLGISQALLQTGHTVSIVSRKPQEIDAIEEAKVSYFNADLTNTIEAGNVFEKIYNNVGPIDGLVNNIGKSAWKALGDIDEQFLDEMFSVNVKACLFAIKKVMSFEDKPRSIVNVSSLAGKRGSANNSVYCASKFALNGLTQSLAKELGGQGVRVNAVCPVYVETPGVLEALSESISPVGDQSISEYFKTFSLTQTALNRLPQSNEVGAFCRFLISQESSAITGQCMNIDCGVLPQ